MHVDNVVGMVQHAQVVMGFQIAERRMTDAVNVEEMADHVAMITLVLELHYLAVWETI